MEKDPEHYVKLVRRRQEQYDKLIGETGLIKKWEDSYYLRHYDKVGDDDNRDINSEGDAVMYQHTDTVPTDYVNQLMAMMTVPDPVRTFYTDNQDSETAKDRCDAAEKYVHGVWRANQTRSRIRIRRAMLFDQIVRAGAYVYVWWDDRRYKFFKKEKGLPRDAYFPIVIEVLPPRCCLPNPENGMWGWADDFVRAEKLSPQRVARIWGRDRVLDCIDDADEIDEESETANYEYYDIWQFVQEGDKAPVLWNGIVYNEKWLIEPRAMPKYRDIPVIYIAGVDTPAEEVQLRSQSVLAPLIPNYRTLERIINRIMTVATLQADPTILARMEEPAVIKKGAGAVIPLRPGEMISYLTGIGASPQLLQVFQLVQNDLQRSSLPRVSFGDAPSGWSGYMANQAIAGGSLKNQPIADNHRAGLSAIDQTILNLSSAFFGDQSVTVYGNLRARQYTESVNPSKFEELRIQTALDPKTPSDEQAKFSLALMARTPGPTGIPLLSDNHIRREMLGIEDAQAAGRDILRQQIKSLPTVVKYEVAEILRTSDWPKHVASAVVAELEQQMGGPGGAPPGAAPGAPQGAPPGEMPPAEAAQPPAGPGQMTPEQAIQVIQAGVQSGQLPPDIAQQAMQAIQQGAPVEQVMQGLVQAVQQGGAPQGPPPQGPPGPPAGPPPMPPPGMMPQMPPQGPPAAPSPDQLRQQIDMAVQGGQLPPQIGQQAMMMLDQGQPVEAVIAFLDQAVSQMQAGGQPEGEPTLEEAAVLLQQNGYGPDAVAMLNALVQQRGMSVSEAVRAVVAAQAEGTA